MLRKALSMTLALIITLGMLSSTAFASGGLIASPTASTVIVDGSKIAFDAYSIDNYNYFKLRDIAYALNGTAKQFEVEWNGANNAISLISSQPYTVLGDEMASKGSGNKTPIPTNSRIYLNGCEIRIAVYSIGDNNYFKLRDLGQALGFDIEWDGARNTIVIDTSKGKTPEDSPCEPTWFVPPPFECPYIVFSGAIVIDDIVYAKPGQIIMIEGASTNSYLVMEIYVNQTSMFPELKNKDTDYYTITPETKSQSALVFKAAAPIGYRLPINASFFGEIVIHYGPNGERGLMWSYQAATPKTAVVIPADCLDVVKGADGKTYLMYSGGVKRELIDDGTSD